MKRLDYEAALRTSMSLIDCTTIEGRQFGASVLLREIERAQLAEVGLRAEVAELRRLLGHGENDDAEADNG